MGFRPYTNIIENGNNIIFVTAEDKTLLFVSYIAESKSFCLSRAYDAPLEFI